MPSRAECVKTRTASSELRHAGHMSGTPDAPRDAHALTVGVVTAFPPGRNSLNEFGYHLVRHLAPLDDVAEVVAYVDETDAGAPEPMPGVRFVAAWRFNALANVVRVLLALRRTKPDAVIWNLQFATFGDQRIPGALGLFLPALARLMGVRSLVVLHNLADNVDMQEAGFASSPLQARIMRLAGRILTRVLLRADLVAVTIPRYVEFLREEYGARNVLLAPHGSFEEVQEPDFSPRPAPRQIMAFGKWGTYKRVEVLVDAYRLLQERGYDDIALVLAGTDSPNAAGYMAGIAAANTDLPGLSFTGYVAEEDVPRVFGDATVVAFPYTSTTGSSGVLHQAGEYGRAVALPRVGDLVDIIEEEGFTGEYFEPTDPASLADALARILDDPEHAEEIGRRNFVAATGIPMSEVVQWHLLHLRRILPVPR